MRRSGLFFSQSLTLTQGINAGAGASASLGASLMLPLSFQSAFTTGVSIKFADARQMRYDFGINPEQAERRRSLIGTGDSHLQAGDGVSYNPGGGIHSIGVNARYIRELSGRWALIGFGSYGYLFEPAANSPLTDQKSQITLGIGFGWKF